MRCLTLADALRAEGAACRFVCRAHEGNLFDLIRLRGYEVVALPAQDFVGSESISSEPRNRTTLDHAVWLGATWENDAEQTKAALVSTIVDWIVIDHYAIDARWELKLKSCARHLMVIDDLADREHCCDILLDQNFIEGMETRYDGIVPKECITLLGPQYALLRPEFSAFRQFSMARRQVPELGRLLVFMGGSDPDNETCKVMAAIKLSTKAWNHIDVVVGQCFPALPALRECLENIPAAVLHIQSSEMAQLLASADLAVTGGGSVTWEKCVLAVPSLVLILGENQRPIATMMHHLRAQRTVGNGEDVSSEELAMELNRIDLNDLAEMAYHAGQICDGFGARKVVQAMLAATSDTAASTQ